ncbi:hypothetical protein BCR35DRAFT_300799 [Leucosporidium creatinivorum]|uniref:BZIP domain-containing protein n=1 Tax=Leucosporidium creatinivorum TaxID=106004 RepID=A0A1Y2FY76_9BASI|nr:hypothetical protein BCR35DRAFT_300799 [Leucosporidium creatinivorum]
MSSAPPTPLQPRPLLPSLNSLSRLVHSPPPPQREHLSTYNPSRPSPHALPSCAILASTCPPTDFPPAAAAYPSPSPSSAAATSLPPVSSIAPLLHACSAASHAMSAQQQDEQKPQIKQELDATPSSTTPSQATTPGPFTPAALYGEASRTGGTLGSSASFIVGEGGWPQVNRSGAGSFAAPTPTGGEDVKGSNVKGKGKSEDGDTTKIKSASPDSVGSGEGSAAGGKTLKQTKRAAQNREAQRAFRSRKEQYIKELEHTATLYTALQSTHTSLTQRLTTLESSLTSLESDRLRFESERAAFDAERCLWERERAAFAAERSSFATERAGWAGEKAGWENERRRMVDKMAKGELPECEMREEEEEEGEKVRKREEARMALRRELEMDACLPAPKPVVNGSGSAVGQEETEGGLERDGKRMRVE